MLRRRGVLAALALGTVAVTVATVVGVRVLRDPPPATGGPPLRLWATAEQWRTDEVNRTVEIALRNDGPRPVRVTRLELDFPSFAGAGTVEPAALLPPDGQRVDVPVPYGTGRCPGASPDADPRPDSSTNPGPGPGASSGPGSSPGPGSSTGAGSGTPTSAPAAVVVEAVAEGGSPTRVRLALPHPNPLLDRLLTADCQQQRLARAVAIGFGAWRTSPDGSLAGTVEVRRAAEDLPVTVQEVTGSILILVRPLPIGRTGPLGTLGAGRRLLRIPVSAAAARCDAHAIAEIKKPFEFPVRASVGGVDLPSTVTVTDPDRAVLDAMVRRQCKLPD